MGNGIGVFELFYAFEIKKNSKNNKHDIYTNKKAHENIHTKTSNSNCIQCNLISIKNLLVVSHRIAELRFNNNNEQEYFISSTYVPL